MSKLWTICAAGSALPARLCHVLGVMLAITFAIANVHSADSSKLNAGELQAAAKEAPFNDQAAIAERAVELLLETNLSNVDDATPRLIELAQPALANLSDEQRDKFSRYLEDSPTTGRLSFDQLKARYALQAAARQDQNTPAELVEAWVTSVGLEKLSVDELAWCYQQSLPNDVDRKEFTVTWNGTLTPPHAGKYTFSVSPINVNSLGREQVRHSIKVSVAGQPVLETPVEHADKQGSQDDEPNRRVALGLAEWKPEGNSLALEAGKLVPIQVEMKYSCNEISERNPASAILFWEGPGINRQVVPAKVLAGPESKAQLQVEYRWPVGAEERLVVGESDNIDYLVDSPANIAPPNRKFIEKLAERLVELATSKQYLDACAAGKTQHVYLREEAATGGLSTPEREQFLETLSARGELITGLTAEQMVTLYEGFRFGNEERALDVVGQWMQAHANTTPEITLDFFRVNRQPYWELGQVLGGQLPEHVKLLQDRYLVLEDGRCVLPVAYTLSYASLAKDRSQSQSFDPDRHRPTSTSRDWLAVLTEELRNDDLVGDSRVNWLLARLQASEEPLGIVDGPDATPAAMIADRGGWLDEAKLVAETEDARYRLDIEAISRLVVLRGPMVAKSVLSELTEQYSTASTKKTLQTQAKILDELQLESKARADAWRDTVSNSYIKVIERRIDQAKARGDDITIEDLSRIIERHNETRD